MQNRKIVELAYDAGILAESTRHSESEVQAFEFHFVLEKIKKILPNSKCIIYDIGSGSGKYSKELLKLGHKVGLVDLSQKSLDFFKDNLDENLCENILFTKASCASNLPFIPSESANSILLMGPLYHLPAKEDRTKVLEECYRILKQNGKLFSIHLSPFPIVKSEAEARNINQPTAIQEIEFEMETFTQFMGFNVPQFRIWVKDCVNELEMNGFSNRSVHNIEGLACHSSEFSYKKLEQKFSRDSIFRLLNKTNQIPELLGITEQYLVVSEKINADNPC
jgi:ubiquinone/menaquinone biosynthesis C-methylase UbiE